MIELVERGATILLTVRVAPRASRDAIEGEWQGALKIRLVAPPVDDRANEALCRFLAARLKIARSAVKIVAGQKSRTKRVEIRGLTGQRVRDLIAATAPSPARNYA